MYDKRSVAGVLVVAAFALAAARSPSGSGAGQYGGNQSGGNQNSGNQNGGNQNGGNQNAGNQNSGNQSGGNQNGGNQNGGNQNGGNQNGENQNGGNQNGGSQNGGSQNPVGPDGAADSTTALSRGAPDSDADAPAPRVADPELTINDAREDFSTIVESYLLKKGRGGAWSYRDARGRRRDLALVKVEMASVALASRRRYAGLVRLRDVADGKETKLVFTVDLSGDDWKVVSVAEPRAAKKSGVR